MAGHHHDEGTRSNFPPACKRRQALYGHYEKTFKLWEQKGVKVPPYFIIVCQNTASLLFEMTARPFAVDGVALDMIQAPKLEPRIMR